MVGQVFGLGPHGMVSSRALLEMGLLLLFLFVILVHCFLSWIGL
jgi:hypothetical protein